MKKKLFNDSIIITKNIKKKIIKISDILKLFEPYIIFLPDPNCDLNTPIYRNRDPYLAQFKIVKKEIGKNNIKYLKKFEVNKRYYIGISEVESDKILIIYTYDYSKWGSFYKQLNLYNFLITMNRFVPHFHYSLEMLLIKKVF